MSSCCCGLSAQYFDVWVDVVFERYLLTKGTLVVPNSFMEIFSFSTSSW